MSTSASGRLSARANIAGGFPDTVPDIPVSVIFLVLYVVGAVGNVFMFIRYSKRLKWQMALFGYCMSRITTMALRLAWTEHVTNSNLSIASQVFLNAGVLLIFLINLMMTKKLIFRTHHYYFQDNPKRKDLFKKVFAALGFLLIPFLIIVIVGAVQGFLVKNPSILKKDVVLRKVGLTTFLIYCVLPVPLVAINAVYRHKRGKPPVPDHRPPPGIGRKAYHTNRELVENSLIILVVAGLVTFEYAIKTVQVYTPTNKNHWAFGKGTFYATSILPEMLAMFILLVTDMSKRFCGFAMLRSDDDENMIPEASEKPAKP